MPHAGKVFLTYSVTGTQHHRTHLLWSVLGKAGLYLSHNFGLIRILSDNVYPGFQYWTHIIQIGLNEICIQMDKCSERKQVIHGVVINAWKIGAIILMNVT